MSATTTVNVSQTCAESCASTPGNFNVRAHYTEVDAGHLFGPFATREQAEKCVLVLSGRSDVVHANIEGVV